MTAFRFRAQAALDLRVRELQDAQRDLARAEEARDAAKRRLEASIQQVAQARQQAADAQRTAHDVTGLEWYRFWILRLDHERAAHAAQLAARQEDVKRAAARCMKAQQRRDALDRFKEKARAAFDDAARAAETKLIDELATRRYAVQAPDSSRT